MGQVHRRRNKHSATQVISFEKPVPQPSKDEKPVPQPSKDEKPVILSGPGIKEEVCDEAATKDIVEVVVGMGANIKITVAINEKSMTNEEMADDKSMENIVANEESVVDLENAITNKEIAIDIKESPIIDVENIPVVMDITNIAESLVADAENVSVIVDVANTVTNIEEVDHKGAECHKDSNQCSYRDNLRSTAGICRTGSTKYNKIKKLVEELEINISENEPTILSTVKENVNLLRLNCVQKSLNNRLKDNPFLKNDSETKKVTFKKDSTICNPTQQNQSIEDEANNCTMSPSNNNCTDQTYPVEMKPQYRPIQFKILDDTKSTDTLYQSMLNNSWTSAKETQYKCHAVSSIHDPQYKSAIDAYYKSFGGVDAYNKLHKIETHLEQDHNTTNEVDASVSDTPPYNDDKPSQDPHSSDLSNDPINDLKSISQPIGLFRDADRLLDSL